MTLIDVKRIRIEMASKNLTIKAISEKSGIARQSISKIITRGTCNVANAGKIAEALDIDVSEIIL